MNRKLKAAIIGSGNIETDLMIKIVRQGRHLEIGAMVGMVGVAELAMNAPVIIEGEVEIRP